MRETVELRVHHLRDIAIAIRKGPHEFARSMYLRRYTGRMDDPDTIRIYNQILGLLENPGSFELIVGRADVLCKQCPKFKRQSCEDLFPNFGEEDSRMKSDQQPAIYLGIDTNDIRGREYSREELIRIMGLSQEQIARARSEFTRLYGQFIPEEAGK